MSAFFTLQMGAKVLFGCVHIIFCGFSLIRVFHGSGFYCVRCSGAKVVGAEVFDIFATGGVAPWATVKAHIS